MVGVLHYIKVKYLWVLFKKEISKLDHKLMKVKDILVSLRMHKHMEEVKLYMMMVPIIRVIGKKINFMDLVHILIKMEGNILDILRVSLLLFYGLNNVIYRFLLSRKRY